MWEIRIPSTVMRVQKVVGIQGVYGEGPACQETCQPGGHGQFHVGYYSLMENNKNLRYKSKFQRSIPTRTQMCVRASCPSPALTQHGEETMKCAGILPVWKRKLGKPMCKSF